MTAEQDALRRRIPQHRKLIDLREQVSNTTELRKLAAARDRKRDVAALTLNMAISAAGGNVGWTVAGARRQGKSMTGTRLLRRPGGLT